MNEICRTVVHFVELKLKIQKVLHACLQCTHRIDATTFGSLIGLIGRGIRYQFIQHGIVGLKPLVQFPVVLF